MSAQPTEVFDSTALPELSPFEVLWEQTTVERATTKTGGSYDRKVVVVRSAKYPNQTFGIRLPAKIYQTMRIQGYAGIKRFSATFGLQNEKGFAPLIVNGIKEPVA